MQISGHKVTPLLTEELARLAHEQVYESRVFLIRNLGFCEPTAARRISFEDSLAFEALHEEVYCSFGYELVNVEPAAVTERADWIIEHLPHAFRQRRDGIAGA